MIFIPHVCQNRRNGWLMDKAEAVLPRRNLWVNPDCGLKTRAWAEVKPSLINMVDAAKKLRNQTPKGRHSRGIARIKEIFNFNPSNPS